MAMAVVWLMSTSLGPHLSRRSAPTAIAKPVSRRCSGSRSARSRGGQLIVATFSSSSGSACFRGCGIDLRNTLYGFERSRRLRYDARQETGDRRHAYLGRSNGCSAEIREAFNDGNSVAMAAMCADPMRIRDGMSPHSAGPTAAEDWWRCASRGRAPRGFGLPHCARRARSSMSPATMPIGRRCGPGAFELRGQPVAQRLRCLRPRFVKSAHTGALPLAVPKGLDAL